MATGEKRDRDEIELRLAAVELLLIEVAPWLAVEALDRAEDVIRQGLEMGEIAADEREIRLYALQLLQDGRQRLSQGSIGGWVRGDD